MNFVKHHSFKFFTSCLCLFLSLGLSAQITVPDYVSLDSVKYSFGMNASHDFQSSALKNEFTSILLRGGLIDTELKNSVMDRQKDINRLGREFYGELYFMAPASKFSEMNIPNWGTYYEAGYYSIFAGNYSDDLLDLALNGNSRFLGDSAQFSGSGFKYMDFQTLGIGMYDKVNKSFFTLNIVNVQHYLNTSITTGKMNFSADSTQVDLDLNAGLESTTGANFSNGLGVAVNGCLNIPVTWTKNRNALFQFKLKNFGLAQVKNVQRFEVDTALSYAGFTLDDLLNFNQSKFENNQWMDSLGVSRDTISKWVTLPSMIQFGKILVDNYEGKFQSYFGVKLFPTLKYVPKVYAGIDYRAAEQLHLGLSAAYGGFGNLRFGCYAALKLKKLNLGVGTEDLFGLISKKAYGQMLTLRLKCNIY